MAPAEEMDDEALINAFKAGDASALEMLFRRYRRPVFGWLLQATGDRADAEDGLSEAHSATRRAVSAAGFGESFAMASLTMRENGSPC